MTTTEAQIQQRKPIFLASYVKRYWKLLLVFVVLEILRKIDAVVYFIGPVFFLIELVVAAYASFLLARHLFSRRTLDAYVQRPNKTQPSQFEEEWLQVSPTTRVWATVVIMAAGVLSACIIAASLAK